MVDLVDLNYRVWSKIDQLTNKKIQIIPANEILDFFASTDGRYAYRHQSQGGETLMTLSVTDTGESNFLLSDNNRETQRVFDNKLLDLVHTVRGDHISLGVATHVEESELINAELVEHKQLVFEKTKALNGLLATVITALAYKFKSK